MTSTVDSLRRNRPEWTPWLDVVDEALREAAGRSWDAAVPEEVHRERCLPLLSGAILAVDMRAVGQLFERLAKIAAQGNAPKMRSLTTVPLAEADLIAVFRASVNQDDAVVEQIASVSGVDPEALQALTALLTVPVLQSVNRRWSAAIPNDWTEGYCPVCGAWPAFAEVRGIERSRYLRCGRCGAEWPSLPLHCGFCGTSDHGQLASLVPEAAGTRGSVDACRRCRGYVKVFTTLQGCAPAAVMIEDLASVDLDVAALHQGYSRRQGSGRSPDINVNPTAGRRGYFAWNA